MDVSFELDDEILNKKPKSIAQDDEDAEEEGEAEMSFTNNDEKQRDPIIIKERVADVKLLGSTRSQSRGPNQNSMKQGEDVKVLPLTAIQYFNI